MQEQRPLIGHHLSLDLLFIYHTFIDDLPATYLEFAQEVITDYPAFLTYRKAGKK